MYTKLSSQLARAVVLSISALAVSNVSAITKCQDESGKWHYGDFAAEECEASLHTKIDERGLTVSEEAAPPTAEELTAAQEAEAAQKAAEEKAEREAAAKRAQDERLLSTYENEQSIITARDDRLQSVDNLIEVNKDLTKGLMQRLAKLQEQRQSSSGQDATRVDNEIASIRTQIADYEAANEAKLVERAEIERKYNVDLDYYRRLTQGKVQQEGG